MILLSFTCNKKNKILNENIKVEESPVCLSDNDKILLLIEILNNSDVNKFLHLNLIERMPIKVISNEYFNNKVDYIFNKEKVLFVSDYEKYPDALVIEYSKIDCANSKIDFGFFSKIEGTDILGKIRKTKEGKWEVLISQVGEH